MPNESLNGRAGRTSPDKIAEQAQRLLQASSYSALQQISCRVDEGVLTLHGALPSYFLKQVAQTLVSRLPSVQHINNRIAVRVSGASRRELQLLAEVKNGS